MKSSRAKANYGHYNLRSGLTIYPVQQEAIDRLLFDLGKQIPAHFLLLTDVTGQAVSVWGEQSQVNLVALGSLVAGDLAASQEIARLTGQYENSQLILREGRQTHTLIAEAGLHLALFIQVSSETPLGWARMLIRKAAQQLAEAAATPPGQHQPDEQIDRGLNQADLVDLFTGALDEMWQE